MRIIPPPDPHLIQYRDAPGPGLEAVAIAVALAALLAGVARGATPAVVTPEGRQTTSALIENLPIGVTFYQANAMGPASLRASVYATINSVKPRDSTIVMETKGASRLGCWLYALPDSGVHTDSTRVVFFGVTPKIHLTAVPDSGTSAIPVQIGADTLFSRRGGLRGLLQDYNYLGAGLAGENTDICNKLLPGEIVVPVLSYASFGLGLPRARYFEIAASDFGASVLPPYMSLVVRVLGHTDQWPAATLIRLPSRRLLTRLDVWGLR